VEPAQASQTQPLVSIVIPARNEKKSIAACLESVFKDRYFNKEVIVVDDASTDHTSNILKRFPVTVIRNTKPMGPSSARNIGVAKAKGETIIFIDAHCIITDPH
jgi:glycosyltransferase involved in cell wall biosynthesis